MHNDSVEDETFGSKISTKDFLEQDVIEGNALKRKVEQVYFRISAISLGEDIAITTAPSEYFCEIGIQVKRKSPFEYTLVSNLTNGWTGYVPMSYSWDEGGYEPRESWLEQGTAEWVIDEHDKLLKKCKAL